MAVTNDALPAVFQPQVLVRCQQDIHLRLDRSGQQLPGTVSQNLAQGIVNFSWLTQRNYLTFSHGVSLLLGDVAGSSPPRYATYLTTHHPLPAIAPSCDGHDVFLSYSSNHRAAALVLKAQLDAAKLSVF